MYSLRDRYYVTPSTLAALHSRGKRLELGLGRSRLGNVGARGGAKRDIGGFANREAWFSAT